MDLQLRDKRALVTGSSRGLGYAAALLLAKEGCRVAINSRDEAKASTAAQGIAAETGAQVIALAGDVTDPDVPERLVGESAHAFGGLDILITNTGGPPSGPFESFNEAAWQKAVDLSLMSHVRLIRAALPYLRKSKAASVLTVTSYSVKQPIPNLVLSNSIRAATVGLTKSLALELGVAGIGPRFHDAVRALDRGQLRVPGIQLRRPKFLTVRDVLEDVLLPALQQLVKTEPADTDVHRLFFPS